MTTSAAISWVESEGVCCVTIPGPAPSKGSFRVCGKNIIPQTSKNLFNFSATWLELVMAKPIPDSWCRENEVHVEILVSVARPKMHFNKNGVLLSKFARDACVKTNAPDVDKTVRAVLDTCENIGYVLNDKQVTRVLVERRWSRSTSGWVSVFLRNVGPLSDEWYNPDTAEDVASM